MATFYKPIVFQHNELPIILYPYMGIETRFERNSSGSLEQHISQLLSDHPDMLQDVSYVIVILWTMNGDVMTDVWLFGQFESWAAGPTIFVRNFKNNEADTVDGVTAGDGILLLGREEEQRRKATDTRSFISGNRPELPGDLNPTDDFYV